MNMETAKDLLASKKYREAREVIDGLLTKDPESDSLWYLSGILSLKLKNYDGAQESFTKAILINKKSEYFRMKGIAHMEIFELEEAIKSFEGSVSQNEKDVLSTFFLSVCYMFYDNPLAIAYIRKAYAIDRKKTKHLLKRFYSSFFGGKKMDGKIRGEILKKMENI